MNNVTKFETSYSRLSGLVLLAIGVGFSVFAVYIFNSGGSFDIRLLLIIPVGFLYGLAGFVEPRILQAHKPEIDRKYKLMSVAIFLVAAAIFAYMRFVIFKNWQ